MAGVIENYSKFEVRAVVRFLHAEGVSQSEIHHRLVSVYGQNVFSRKEVAVWCNKFKHGQTALNDDDPQKHRGRSRTSHTDENCVIVEGLIREVRRVKIHEIAEMTGIAKSTVHEIISDLNFGKVSARLVLKMLTEEHKSKRMAASLENLCCYQDGESFMKSIITGDENLRVHPTVK
jgi:transposase